MLITESQFKKFDLAATDGSIGSIEEFYFDDHEWVVRYLIVDTGGWLTGRRVLLIPDVAGIPDLKNKHLPVNLTCDKIRHSPPTDFEKPLDEEKQHALAVYYGWPAYWGTGLMASAPYLFLPVLPIADESRLQSTAAVAGSSSDSAGDAESSPKRNIHLRSSRAIKGYGISALSETFGHVDDYVLEIPGWRVRYLAIDTRNWLPGKHVLIPPAWISAVDWNDRKVYVQLSRSELEQAPAFDAGHSITREDEVELFKYYSSKAKAEVPQ